jgi:hypothetical protein
MTIVFEAEAAARGRGGQVLDASFCFIHARQRRILQRIRIGTDDVYRFLLELLIILGPVRKGNFPLYLLCSMRRHPKKSNLLPSLKSLIA